MEEDPVKYDTYEEAIRRYRTVIIFFYCSCILFFIFGFICFVNFVEFFFCCSCLYFIFEFKVISFNLLYSVLLCFFLFDLIFSVSMTFPIFDMWLLYPDTAFYVFYHFILFHIISYHFISFYFIYFALFYFTLFYFILFYFIYFFHNYFSPLLRKSSY